MSDDNFGISLFGDPKYLEAEREYREKNRQLRNGDGKHFVIAWIGDQEIETDLVCEWPEGDTSAPCYLQPNGGCMIQESYRNIGRDLFEKNSDESQLLKVRLPIGYREEGSGPDYEDFIYSVRPKVGFGTAAHEAFEKMLDSPGLPEGTEPRDRQILDPEDGTVYLPHGKVTIDGEVTLDD